MKRKKRRVWKAVVLFAITAAFFIFIRDMKPYVVLSGSMEPVIPVGSVVIIDQSKTAVSAGDIAAFSRNGQTVTHRIIKGTEDGFITKGDANQEKDTGVTAPENIIGTVVFCIPYLGYGIMWLQEYRNLVIGVAVLLLFLILLFSGIQESEKNTDHKLEKKENEKGEIKL